MIFKFFLLVSLSLIYSCKPAEVIPEWKGKRFFVKPGGVRVKSESGLGGKTIGFIQAGREVQVNEESKNLIVINQVEGKWLKVQEIKSNLNGWIFSSDLSTNPPKIQKEKKSDGSDEKGISIKEGCYVFDDSSFPESFQSGCIGANCNPQKAEYTSHKYYIVLNKNGTAEIGRGHFRAFDREFKNCSWKKAEDAIVINGEVLNPDKQERGSSFILKITIQNKKSVNIQVEADENTTGKLKRALNPHKQDESGEMVKWDLKNCIEPTWVVEPKEVDR